MASVIVGEKVNNLIERIARALCINHGVDPDRVGGTWDGGKLPDKDPAWTNWIGSAETALEITIEYLKENLDG